MSLKAKLEAVIYAAEEPVTLAQLALLFTQEALEWKAEQEAAAQATEAPSSEGESEPTVNAELGFNEPELAATPESLPESPSPASPQAEDPGPEGEDSNVELPVEEGADLVSGSDSEAAGEAAAEAALKREARLRDREVRNILRQLLDELIVTYAADGRGIEIREIAGGYRMATKPEYHDAVRTFVKSLKPALKLSLPALETLAVIAYKQPVTAPEVNEIRGVDSSGVFGSLLARKLIATAGRKPVIGRPILYKTTKEFLLRFGLKDVTELPSMEEFEKMAAIELEEPELDESEHAGQRDAVPEFREDLSLEVDRDDAEEHEDEASAEATTEAAPIGPPPTE
jgi:segregation and condensation protein B